MSLPSDWVSDWIQLVLQGQREAADAIWAKCFPQLVNLARARLSQQRDCSVDAPDLTLSVLQGFSSATRYGRISDLKDRDELWRLLSNLTRRKAIDYLTRTDRFRSSDGPVSDDVALVKTEAVDLEMAEIAPNEVTADDTTSNLIAILTDLCEQLLNQLEDYLRVIVLKKLEGFSDREIGRQLGCATATVERRLRLIQTIWHRAETTGH